MCILSGGVWFTPGDFERFSGREKSKNWKLTIRCENITLHELIQVNFHYLSDLQSAPLSPLQDHKALPLKRIKKEDIWTLDCDKNQLPVTCGGKEGTLYRDKLARGEKCILSRDRWFTPCDFERFSGKGNSRKWKHTISCQNTTLHKLIQDGHLQCPRTYRVYGRKNKTFSSSCVESSSPQLASIVETNESSEDHEKWIEEEDNEQEEEEEEDSEKVDLSEFQAFALSVSCGCVSGFLYKDRFAGSRSKSIRTEERWFTPEEFVMQELTLTDGHWKEDILCHGKTLNYLVKECQ
ncbi:nuclear autoantigen Sp-100 [Ictalurus punctatus]|uniref:Nuclear autoantigen Sp-100 n=1 Tax=Ictalurus punctatus TaxID=7998 RepID=A0A9F7RDK4_ICTPU|nr:nuclear autoantigen Sp-100 [Ictalurus punctatus]